ncbi:MAG: ATP-binding protein [Ignavibacteria bacterium]|nr:ATP-binding protein [Ignavibacteria bacterium]
MKTYNFKNFIIKRLKNAFNFKSIYFKSAMLSWTLIIITVIMFFFGIIPFQKDSAINKMRSESKDIATSVAQVTATAIISEDYSFAVEHCMNVLKGSHSIQSIVITKNDGFSLLHTKEEWSSKNLDSTWYLLDNQQTEGYITKSRFGDFDVFEYSHPLIYSGINWGWIHIENSLDQYNEDFDTIYKRLIALSLVLIAGGFLWSFFFASRLVKPIHLVDSVAQSIASGNLVSQIKMKSYTEIESLANSFNLMSINLKRAHDELESKVKERTIQLENSNRELENYKKHLENLVEERTEEIKEVNDALITENSKLISAETEIANQFNFLKTLLDTIPIPIYILDSKACFTDYNPAFEKHFNKQKPDLLGNSFYSLFADEDQEEFLQKRNQLFKEGFLAFEKRLNYSSNSSKDLIFFESTSQSAFGRTAGIVGVILDITEIKESERKTLNALNAEKDLTELRTKFFSHASHEFRTPLTTIQSSVELISMLNPKLFTQENNPHVEQIFTSISYMQELLDDILTINKADTGKFISNLEVLNLFEFINSLKEEIESNDKFNHQINLTGENKNQTIIGDKKTLRLIFSNLITNSLKYSPAHSTIGIKVYQSDCYMAVRITDNGIGIPIEEQDHIFEPFFRASNAGDIKGTGLGLSLVKKLVDQHQGSIDFHSVPNKETEFIVSLPMNVERIEKEESNQLESSYK